MILATINGNDLTEHISVKSYKINAEPLYKEWQDGNMNTHRIYVRDRISGSFDITLYGKNNVDLQAFLTMLAGSTVNNILTIGLYVANTNEFKMITAYYTTTSKKHVELNDGSYLDVLTVKIEER